MVAASPVVTPPPTTEAYDLRRCIETALIHNDDINRARERVRQQQGVVVTARANFFPELRLDSNFRHISAERIPSFQGQSFGTQENWTVDLILEQSLYTGGRDSANLARQKMITAAVMEELSTIINDVLLIVRERYLGVLLARAQVIVQGQNIELLEAELQSERDRLAAGTVSNFNVLRAEVALANARPTYIRAVNDATLSLEELSRVLGRAGSGESLSVSGELSFTEKPVALTEALAAAKELRPELRRLRALLRAADHGVDLSRADYRPTFTVFGGYGAEKSNFSASSREEQHGWQAGARAAWKLFDGFATSGRVAEAEAARNEAQLALGQGEHNVDVEVRRAFFSYRNAIDLVAASRKVVDQAAESLRLAQARFDAGSATQLDVLDSQVALTQARTNEVQALHDANLVAARLDKATGTVVETTPLPSSER
jgi:outer membrane protein TolC